MSDMAEKLYRDHGVPEGGVPRATLKQLLARFGEVRLVFVDFMGKRSTWERQSGSGVETFFRQVSE